jgi:predicted DNA-binding protein
MISKTKESGRADLLIRMQPELKQRVEKAARLVGKTKTDWVLRAIEVILHVQELQAKAQTEIAEFRIKQEAKFEEILAELAVQQKLGDLAMLTSRTRTQLESAADKELEKYRLQELSHGISEPKTKLERLCKEFRDLVDEAEHIRKEEINRNNIERFGRIIGGVLDWEEEEEFEFGDEYPDVIEVHCDDEEN